MSAPICRPNPCQRFAARACRRRVALDSQELDGELAAILPQINRLPRRKARHRRSTGGRIGGSRTVLWGDAFVGGIHRASLRRGGH